MRFTMRSRLSWSLGGLGIVRSSLVYRQVCQLFEATSANGPHSLSLDSMLVEFALKNSFHIDSGRVNAVGLEFADLNEVLDFDNRYLCGRRHHGIEIASSLAIDKIAPLVALPCLHEREVSLECALHHVFTAIELARFFILGDDGAE